MKILVGNLSNRTTKSSLLEFFAAYDPVYCTIFHSQKSGSSRYCGIVEITGGEKGENHALRTLDETLLNGSIVKLIEVRDGDSQ